MATYQTPGIVLSRTNFGEADRVIRLLTPYHGKLSAVAKGVRKIKSRLAGHLEPFAETSLMLATGRNLEVITSARLIWYPHALTASFSQMNLAFMVATAVDRLTEPGQPQPKLYELLRDTLHDIDAGPSPQVLELWFKLRLLDLLGYRPELAGCIVCGQSGEGRQYFLDVTAGGLTCDTHAPTGAVRMSEADIKFWRLIFTHPYVTIAKIERAESLASTTVPTCDQLYEHHLGRTFKPASAGEMI
jgi:DNA repair protein RecO (recombination protein O)